MLICRHSGIKCTRRRFAAFRVTLVGMSDKLRRYGSAEQACSNCLPVRALHARSRLYDSDRSSALSRACGIEAPRQVVVLELAVTPAMRGRAR